MSEGSDDLAVQSRCAAGDLGIQQAMDIRESASKAFHEIDCRQAVRAAATHGPRPHYDYQPGQESSSGDEAQILLEDQLMPGPARVIAVQLPTTVWLSYNHYLIKAAPEKLRPASEEEHFCLSPDGLRGLDMQRNNSRLTR